MRLGDDRRAQALGDARRPARTAKRTIARVASVVVPSSATGPSTRRAAAAGAAATSSARRTPAPVPSSCATRTAGGKRRARRSTSSGARVGRRARSREPARGAAHPDQVHGASAAASAAASDHQRRQSSATRRLSRAQHPLAVQQQHGTVAAGGDRLRTAGGDDERGPGSTLWMQVLAVGDDHAHARGTRVRAPPRCVAPDPARRTASTAARAARQAAAARPHQVHDGVAPRRASAERTAAAPAARRSPQ